MKSLKNEFLTGMKNKPFMTFLRKWMKGKEFSDVHVAKCLSSMLTHTLIQLDKEGDINYKALDIDMQVNWLQKFIGGACTQEEIKDAYKERFGRFIN